MSYQNTTTNRIDKPIRDILKELMTTYGGISDEELKEKENDLKKKSFDINKHMVNIYNAGEDLQELATASSSPFSERQQVSLEVKLIKT